MSNEKKLKIPPNLLLMDFIGALLVALGIIETTDPGGLLPPQYAFTYYNWVFIIVGVLLMVPIIRFFIAEAKRRQAGENGQDPRHQSSVDRSDR